MEFGERLRDERLRLGLSLEDIEEETKIRKYYIDALEREDYNALPPLVYASGFVKRYAVVLGLDEQEMVAVFKERAYGPELEPEPENIQEPAPIKERNTKPLPVKNILAGLVFLALVLWLGSYIASCITSRVQDNGAAPTQPKTVQKQTQNPPATTPVQPPTQAGVKLKVDAVLRTWMTITVDGKTAYSQIMAAGDSRTFEGKNSIDIRTGNAGGIKLTVNGQEQPQLGKVGDVVEKEYKAGQ